MDASCISVRNPRMGPALRQMCLNHPHIQLFEHHEAQVSGSLSSPVVSSHGQRVVADRIVLTTGAWTGVLLSGLNLRCPIKPMKGQMLLFSPCRLVNRVVLANGRYAIPRADGRIVFGSTLEDVGFQRTPDRDAFESLYASALLRFLHSKTLTWKPSGLVFGQARLRECRGSVQCQRSCG